MIKSFQTAPSTIKFLLYLEWLTIASGIILLSFSETLNSFTIFGCFLVFASFIFRSFRTKHIIPSTGLEIPWLFFILSALAACLFAYNHEAAILQFMRIFAALTIYYEICESNNSTITLLAYSFVLFAVFLAFYWVLQNNFNPNRILLNSIQQLGSSINYALPKSKYPWLFPITIHKNVAAGVLVLAIPFGISLMIKAIINERISK